MSKREKIAKQAVYLDQEKKIKEEEKGVNEAFLDSLVFILHEWGSKNDDEDFNDL